MGGQLAVGRLRPGGGQLRHHGGKVSHGEFDERQLVLSKCLLTKMTQAHALVVALFEVVDSLYIVVRWEAD